MEEKDNKSSTTENVNPREILNKCLSNDILLTASTSSVYETYKSSTTVSSRTRTTVRLIFFGIIVLLCAIFIIFTGIDLANFSYINKNLKNINSKSIIYYAVGLNFPSLILPTSQSYKDIETNLQYIKNLGVTNVLVEMPDAYNKYFHIDKKELEKFVILAHQVGISVYFRWETLGIGQSGSSFVDNHSEFFSVADLTGYRALDYTKSATFDFIVSKLKIYSDAGVDGFVFNDMPRTINTMTNKFDKEINVSAIIQIKKAINKENRFIPLQFFTLIKQYSYYDVYNYGEGLDGIFYFYHDDATGLNLDYDLLFTNITNELKKYSHSNVILAPARILTINLKVPQKEFIALMAGYMMFPYSNLFAPGSEYCRIFESSYSNSISSVTATDKKYEKLVQELYKLKKATLGKNNKDNIQVYNTNVTVIHAQSVNEKGVSIQLVYMFNHYSQISQQLDLKHYNVKPTDLITIAFSTAENEKKEKIEGTVITINPKEAVIMKIRSA